MLLVTTTGGMTVELVINWFVSTCETRKKFVCKSTVASTVLAPVPSTVRMGLISKSTLADPAGMVIWPMGMFSHTTLVMLVVTITTQNRFPVGYS